MVLTKIKSSREATLISIYLPPRQTQVTRRVSDDFDAIGARLDKCDGILEA